jgi:hypothetical protein
LLNNLLNIILIKTVNYATPHACNAALISEPTAASTRQAGPENQKDTQAVVISV